MNVLKTVWGERANILSLLNTASIVLIAYVLWTQMPHTSRDDLSKLNAQNEGIDKLIERLDRPLAVQSDGLDKLVERLNSPLSVTVSNETLGLKGVLQTTTVPFKIDATVEGKGGLANPVNVNTTGTLKATVEGGSQFVPVHISNP
jgi:hypothetical protein